MTKAFKNAAAALTLVTGLGMAGAASAEPDVNDKFDQQFADRYTVSACTNDNHTASSIMVTYESLTDWQPLAGNTPDTATAFQKEFNAKAQPILDKMWADIINKHSKDDFETASKAFIDDIQIDLKSAADEIEKQTGISILMGGEPTGPTTPGCQ